MIYFTAYANQKFILLNNHQVYIRKEQVEQAVRSPEKRDKVGKYLTAEREGIKAVYQKQGDLLKIITFYPVKI